jgi:O-antigen/teichoic acid export membrane protein
MFLNNIFSLALAQIFGRVIRFGYLILIAHFLVPSEVGIYLYGIALYLSVIGLSEFGQKIFLANRLSGLKRLQKSIIENSFFVVLGFSLVVSIFLIIYIVLSEPANTERLIVLCFVGALMARSLSSWVRAVYIAIENPVWIPRYELIFRSAEALAGILVLMAGGGVLALSFIHFLFWLLEAIFAFKKLSKELPLFLSSIRLNFKYIKLIISLSKYFFISTAVIGLFSQISIILLRYLDIELSYIGVFAISMQFFTTLIIFPDVVLNAFMPRLSRAFNKGDGGGDLVTGVKLLWLISLIVAIGAAVIGPFIIGLLLSDEYEEVSSIFYWLSWCFIPYALALFLGQSLNVIDRKESAIWVMITMVVVHVGLLVYFIDDNLLIATVGSLGIGAFSGFIFALFFVRSFFTNSGIGWILKMLLVTGVSLFLVNYYREHLLMGLLTGISFALIGMYLLNVFNEKDKKAIRRVLGFS